VQQQWLAMTIKASECFSISGPMLGPRGAAWLQEMRAGEGNGVEDVFPSTTHNHQPVQYTGTISSTLPSPPQAHRDTAGGSASRRQELERHRPTRCHQWTTTTTTMTF
jgi:hypothetical protein